MNPTSRLSIKLSLYRVDKKSVFLVEKAITHLKSIRNSMRVTKIFKIGGEMAEKESSNLEMYIF